MTFDYKEYSISQLRNWVSDALSAGDVDAQEIYDVIRDEVSQHIDALQKQLDNGKKLQNLLLGHREFSFDDIIKRSFDDYDSDDLSMFYEGTDVINDPPNTWIRTVEVDGLSGECFITLPDELIELKGWKENDQLEWIDIGDGQYELRKINED
jgi:hypothetical protein